MWLAYFVDGLRLFEAIPVDSGHTRDCSGRPLPVYCCHGGKCLESTGRTQTIRVITGGELWRH